MYKTYRSDFIKHFNFLLADLLCFQLPFLIPYFTGVSKGNSDAYIRLQLLVSLVSLCVAGLMETYHKVYMRGYLKELRAVVFLVSVDYTVTVLFCFIVKNSSVYSRLTYAIMWIATIILVYLERILMKKLCRKSFQINKDRRMILLICGRAEAVKIIMKLRENRFNDYYISGIGLTDGNGLDREFMGIPVVANFSDQKALFDYLTRNVVDELMIKIDENYSEYSSFISKCVSMGIVVHFAIDDEEQSSRQIIENFGGYTVITRGVNIVSSRQLIIKRAMDILGSIVGLLITAVAFIFVTPAIFIASPGPIFFSQIRIGKNGRQFKMYKFRSMYLDAEARKAELMAQNKMHGNMFKIDNDPRIIKGIGHFIRKISVDELPQFFNVFKGDMSLVGTRPPTLDEFEKYETSQKSRLAAKPGITGLWQISGRSDITDFNEVVALDNKYIENWDIGMDIKIFFKTVLIVFGKRGAE